MQITREYLVQRLALLDRERQLLHQQYHMINGAIGECNENLKIIDKEEENGSSTQHDN